TLVMNPAIPVAIGDVGFVIRDENVVATISFSVKEGETTASIVELSGSAGVQPFDTIIVQVKPDGQN
ncbi:MAG: hypothetical protein Q8M76_19340, partial [Spirochaetaceae bacterium]|nr:hypothetical protein [Spirochaetaceae bacterium]